GEKGVDSGHRLIDLDVAADSREGDALAQPSGIVKYKHTTAMIDQIDLVAVKNQLIHPDACDFPIEVAGFGEKFELCRVLLKFVLGLIVQPDVLTIRQDGMADQEIKIFIEGVLGYFVQVFVQDIEFLKIGIERIDPEIGRSSRVVDREIKIVPVRRVIPEIIFDKAPLPPQHVSVVRLIYEK